MEFKISWNVSGTKRIQHRHQKHEITWAWSFAQDHCIKFAKDCEHELIPREFFFFETAVHQAKPLLFVSLVYIAAKPRPANKNSIATTKFAQSEKIVKRLAVSKQHPNLQGKKKRLSLKCAETVAPNYLEKHCRAVSKRPNLWTNLMLKRTPHTETRHPTQRFKGLSNMCA